METSTLAREDVTVQRPGFISRGRKAVASVLLSLAFLVSGGVAANASAAPDPGTLAGDLAGDTAGGVLNAVKDVLPQLIPWIIAFWAFSVVIRKFMPKNKGVPKL